MEKGDGFIWTVVVYLTSLWKLQGLIASFKLKLVESSLCLLWLKISFVLLMNSVYVNSLQIIISSFVNMTFVFNYHSTGFLFLLQCSLHSHPHETATKACLTILQKVSCLHWFTIYIFDIYSTCVSFHLKKKIVNVCLDPDQTSMFSLLGSEFLCSVLMPTGISPGHGVVILSCRLWKVPECSLLYPARRCLLYYLGRNNTLHLYLW